MRVFGNFTLLCSFVLVTSCSHLEESNDVSVMSKVAYEKINFFAPGTERTIANERIGADVGNPLRGRAIKHKNCDIYLINSTLKTDFLTTKGYNVIPVSSNEIFQKVLKDGDLVAQAVVDTISKGALIQEENGSLANSKLNRCTTKLLIFGVKSKENNLTQTLFSEVELKKSFFKGLNGLCNDALEDLEDKTPECQLN